MGGLYVKFAQLLLLNQVFSTSIPPELRRSVFDRVHVDASQNFRDFFTARDMRLLQTQLTHIDEVPRYAGSFAAVFDATHHNGQAVIIKVIRPELRHDLKRDLRLLGLMNKGVGMFKEEVKTSLRAAYQSFRETTLRETDYIAEVANARRLHETLKEDPVLYIPHTYTEICTSHFIVQEKLQGVWLTELLQQDLKSEAASDYVRAQVGSDIYYQLYQLGYRSLCNTFNNLPVHGDPHPGNVVLMPDNRVGLIDFGIIAEPVNNRIALLEYVKEQIQNKEGNVDLARLMISIVRFHASYLYRAIETLGDVYKRPLVNDLYTFLQSEIQRAGAGLSNDDIAHGRHSDMLSASINHDNRFALIPKLDNPLTQKAFITIWRTYDELGFTDMILQVFKATVATIEQQNDVATWRESPMSPERAFEVIAEWLTLVSEKDSALYRRISKLFQPMGIEPAAPKPEPPAAADGGNPQAA